MINNKSYNPLLDPGTGDYVITNGDTVKDFSLQYAAYVRMKVQRKNWLYAPDAKFGSDIHKVLKRGNNTPRLLETMAYQAMQPLLEDGRAKEITTVSRPLSRNNCNLEINILEANNAIQTFQFNPVE